MSPLTHASPGTTVELGELNLTADSMLHSDSAGAAEAISDVASGRVLASQGASTKPAYSSSPTLTGLTLSGLTLGSVPFAGTGGVISEDNAKLFWDNTNKRFGIGTGAPSSKLHIVDGLKASAGEQVRWNIGTDDGGGTMELATRVFGGATGADRYVDIQSVEQGVSVRALTLQPSGGNVGIGTTTPLARLAINGGLHVGGDSDPGDNNLLVAGTGQVNGVLTIRNGTTTVDGGLSFDRTNEDLSIGDGSASQIVHMGAWKTWTPSFTGFSANPSVSAARYIEIGKLVIVHLNTANGTSNATGFTFTLPIAAANTAKQHLAMATVTDNGISTIGGGTVRTNVNSTIVDVFSDQGTAAWTASGGKKAIGVFMYERN